MSTNDVATDLLLQLLSADSMEPAARLKQRLNAKLADSGHGPFNQKTLGFRTFKDYLRSLGDRLKIEERAGSDILVSLGRNDTTGLLSRELATSAALRSDVWLAFTNPDPDRKRFYNKKTGRIEHHSASEEIGREPPATEYISISPLPAAQQSAWMREFLAEQDLESEPLLAQMTATPYSSAVNAAFSKALGKRATAWRKFRAGKVFDEANKWATEHHISFQSLQEAPNKSAPIIGSSSLSPRLRATKLLESFSDQELVDLVIPILAASALVKSRT